eukprot:GHVL01028360.1.p1 GENE.GHVL01028360.1~~GHVL01028360.1.p1  ORF type:complete len:238 (-),score=35.02 GHVL01028360.1:254-967(-)
MDMKKHNFYAGPSILPEYTIKSTAEAVLNFAGTGLSVMEVSRRSKEFVAVMNKARQLIKKLLDIPAGYDVIFVGGGASTQFCAVPYNLLNNKAAYLNTGTWSTKTIKEAKLFGKVVEVASSSDKNFNYIPKGFEVPSDIDYIHITTSNTIYGTEIKKDLEFCVPLVADMSSDIFEKKQKQFLTLIDDKNESSDEAESVLSDSGDESLGHYINRRRPRKKKAIFMAQTQRLGNDSFQL